MRIRKIKSTNNEYIYAGNVWVRNFAKWGAKPLNESCMIPNEDQLVIINNEYSNKTFNLGNIADEKFLFENIVIISDGFDFENKVKDILEIPKICILAVNGALKKWNIYELQKKKAINFYVVNNPYDECMFYLPKKYFPVCVASSRTNTDFLGNYPGVKYLYQPTPERVFGLKNKEKYYIDDYRNPICGAIGLAYQFGVKKLMLLSCDDSFKEKREQAVQMSNGLWTYPHHLRSQNIIDANFFWLNRIGVKIADYSSGEKYKYATCINTKEEIKLFFETKI